MFRALGLLIPALVPSWRFFDVIRPSPRISYCFCEAPEQWVPLLEQPERVTIRAMVLRLFWNARRNDDLFAISCAERILEQPTEHSLRELRSRIASRHPERTGAQIVVRIDVVSRVDGDLIMREGYRSDRMDLT